MCGLRIAVQSRGTASLGISVMMRGNKSEGLLSLAPSACSVWPPWLLRVRCRAELEVTSVSHTRALRAAVLSAGQSVGWAPPWASLFSFRGVVPCCSLPRSRPGVSGFSGFALASSRSRLVLFIRPIAPLRHQMPSASFAQRANPAFKRTAPGGLPYLASPALVAPVAAA